MENKNQGEITDDKPSVEWALDTILGFAEKWASGKRIDRDTFAEAEAILRTSHNLTSSLAEAAQAVLPDLRDTGADAAYWGRVVALEKALCALRDEERSAPPRPVECMPPYTPHAMVGEDCCLAFPDHMKEPPTAGKCCKHHTAAAQGEEK